MKLISISLELGEKLCNETVMFDVMMDVKWVQITRKKENLYVRTKLLKVGVTSYYFIVVV